MLAGVEKGRLSPLERMMKAAMGQEKTEEELTFVCRRG